MQYAFFTAKAPNPIRTAKRTRRGSDPPPATLPVSVWV